MTKHAVETPLARAIKAQLQRRGCSLAAMAREIGVPPASAWHWTNGTSQPSISLFEVLRAWLELSSAEMYDLIVTSEPGVAKYRAAIARAKRKAH